LIKLEAKLENRLSVYEADTVKYKSDLKQSIKRMQDRISKQKVIDHAPTPAPEMDVSAILTKRNHQGSK